MGRLHLVSIASDPKYNTRLGDIATEFEYQYKHFENVDAFADQIGDEQVMLTVFSAVHLNQASDIAGSIQVIKQFVPDSFVTVIVEKRISPDAISFIKKSGANLVLMEHSFFSTSQIDYVCSQIIKGSLVPIKASELKPNTMIDFNVLVVMPLNKKILPVAFAGSELSEAKYKKLVESKELYIRRDDLNKFNTYCEKHVDLSAAGIAARCRLKYLNLCKAHSELVYLLIDQGAAASFGQGKILMEDCERLASDLLTNLASVEDPYAIINSSSMGESGSAERSTSIAAMGGLLALSLTGAVANDVVLAGLLSDFGLLELEPKVLKKMRSKGVAGLDAVDMETYVQHPTMSINMCLSRKLPLPDRVKQIISCTHEQFNGKGFPKGVLGDKIPVESQVIFFCQLVDEASLVKMGERRRPVKEIQQEILEKELLSSQRFGPQFLQNIKTGLQS